VTKLLDPVNSGMFSGIVWFSGSFQDGIIDIFWPVFGKMATYTVTDSTSGLVREVGEAYLTF
jgi:hypothetical protein